MHERLYRTQTHTVRLPPAERKLEETLWAEAASKATINKKNADADVTTVPEHGLKIVTYKAGKREQKQDTATTARGYTRNKLGGFYTS